ncbi:MAG: hypothetical protein WAT23_04500 [Chromatiaceae bacterium]
MTENESQGSLIQTLAGQVRGWLADRRATRQRERERAKALAEAIEEVVSGVEPKLRALSGYQRKLGPEIQRFLDFVADIIAQLPPAIELSRAAWQRDPQVNAFFAAANDLPIALSRAPELVDYFEREPLATQAYCIMTSTRLERQVFGIGLQGDMLQRDLAQTSVGFVEPLIMAPSPSETAVRKEAVNRALHLFIGFAQAQVAETLGKREGLEHERHIQEVRLRSLRTRSRGLDADGKARDEILALEQSLAENARQMETLGGPLMGLDATLEQIRALFATSGDQIHLAHIPLRLDRLGIKLEEDDNRTPNPLVNDLALIEFTVGSRRRVITLVRCPRGEMLTMAQLVERVDPFLASQLGIRGM